MPSKRPRERSNTIHKDHTPFRLLSLHCLYTHQWAEKQDADEWEELLPEISLQELRESLWQARTLSYEPKMFYGFRFEAKYVRAIVQKWPDLSTMKSLEIKRWELFLSLEKDGRNIFDSQIGKGRSFFAALKAILESLSKKIETSDV